MTESILSLVFGVVLLFIFVLSIGYILNKQALKNEQLSKELDEIIKEKENELKDIKKSIFNELEILKESLKAKPKRIYNKNK